MLIGIASSWRGLVIAVSIARFLPEGPGVRKTSAGRILVFIKGSSNRAWNPAVLEREWMRSLHVV
jgi:hypothetical protein